MPDHARAAAPSALLADEPQGGTTQTPIVLEGDYLLPEVLAEASGAGRVSGVFLYEQDEGALPRNLFAREPDEGEQAKRARVSCLLGQWLNDECQRLGVPTLQARPWDSLLDRIGAVA